MNREGGTTGVKVGNLKRRLTSKTLANIDNTVVGNVEASDLTFRLLLKGLSDVLGNVFIAVGIINTDGNPVRAADYPAHPGTMQLTPITNFPDRPKMWLRPVFQNPAGTAGTNSPLPQDIPFSWNVSGEADECEIDIVVHADNFAATELNGLLCVQVYVEYDGQWWDEQAVQLALSQVQLTGAEDTIATVGTHVEPEPPPEG